MYFYLEQRHVSNALMLGLLVIAAYLLLAMAFAAALAAVRDAAAGARVDSAVASCWATADAPRSRSNAPDGDGGARQQLCLRNALVQNVLMRVTIHSDLLLDAWLCGPEEGRSSTIATSAEKPAPPSRFCTCIC